MMDERKKRAVPADRQQADPFGLCGCCGGEMYLGQLYYEMEDRLICPECLEEYARSYFLGSQRVAMRPERRP